MQIKPMREIEEFLRPVAESVGCEIVEAVWNNREKSLTIVIDAPGGVDMDLCEKFHRAADVPLDELDPTFGAPIRSTAPRPGLTAPSKRSATFSGTWARRSRCISMRLCAAGNITRERFSPSRTALSASAQRKGRSKFPLKRPPRSVYSSKSDAAAL